jgi:cellulose synthase/poly-beta-1,6-N-acetylglucosamine synthase-like glycosyltransferase
MNIALFFYFACLILVWWSCQGYIIYLYLNRRKPDKDLKQPQKHFFSIIVPTFNEEELIIKKIDGLKSLSSGNFEVFFADASSDRTAEIISKNINGLDSFRLIKSFARGRSSQINSCLSSCKGDLILISDCDGAMPDDTLQKLEREFQDESVGVAGACVLPQTENKYEKLFWEGQNALRFLESGYGFCPVVIGICYAFRKKILGSLPQTVWADDIYVPFFFNSEGFRTVYCRDIVAYELRCPVKAGEFIMHKMRKAGDNIKELLRFSRKIKKMPAGWNIVYGTRFLQVIILPFALFAFAILFVFQPFVVKICTAMFIILSAFPQFYILRIQSNSKLKASFVSVAAMFLVANSILLMADLKYLFLGGKVSYEKVG